MAQVLELLPLMWETRIKIQAPGFLVWPQPLQLWAFGKQSGRWRCLCLCSRTGIAAWKGARDCVYLLVLECALEGAQWCVQCTCSQGIANCLFSLHYLIGDILPFRFLSFTLDVNGPLKGSQPFKRIACPKLLEHFENTIESSFYERP